MEVLLATNNSVRLSFLVLLLRDAGLNPVLYDTNMAVAEGSVSAIQRRLAVPSGEVVAARRVLREAGEL
jgi:hypothetical protein